MQLPPMPLPKSYKNLISIIFFIIFAISLLVEKPQLQNLQIQKNAIMAQTENDFYQVVSVTDGDTIKVIIDNKTETVRVANINTPESVDPRRPVECMGEEASQKMLEIVSDKKVKLETDQTQKDKDRYGRLIRFVFLEDGTDVGLKLIQLGFAQSSPYGDTPHKYLENYKTAHDEAQKNQVGLWNLKNCETDQLP